MTKAKTRSQILSIDKFSSPRECQQLIQLAESKQFSAAPISSRSGREYRMAHLRNNQRVVHDDPHRATQLFSRLLAHLTALEWLPKPCGLNERFRFYRYDNGQKFDWHADGSFRRENGEHSRATVLLYLNEGFKGGETAFKTQKVTPKQGLLVAFPHHLLHCSKAISHGRKYVLRTDVMISPSS